MDPHAYDDIVRHLVQIAAYQETINEDLRAFNRQQVEINRQQVEINRQQVEINADVKTTLARIETLLTRMLRHGGNGRDA